MEPASRFAVPQLDRLPDDIRSRIEAVQEKSVKLAVRPQDVDDDDLEGLRKAGFDEEDIWDIGAITALFALSNRMAHLTGMRPNEEFYLLGRVPRERG